MNRIEDRGLNFNLTLTIDEVLDVKENIQQKVSEIIDFHGISIEKNEDNFLIGKTFKKLFLNCLGFKPCHELLGVMESSKEAFKDSMTAYDVLTPLFLYTLAISSKIIMHKAKDPHFSNKGKLLHNVTYVPWSYPQNLDFSLRSRF